MVDLQNIEREIVSGSLRNAIDELIVYTEENPSDARGFFILGKAYWKAGERSKAISAYGEAAALDPDSPANLALIQAKKVEQFFNPDLLNP